MHRRNWLSFVLLVVIAFAALPLQHLAAASAAPKGPITFYTFGDATEKAAYDSLVAAFNQKYPDVQVKLVHTPGEDEFKFGDQEDAYRERLSLDFASNKPPDVFLMNYREYGIFSSKNALDPAGPYLDKSTVIKPADFYAEALAPFTRNNVLDCVPQNASGTVVYYNKDLFDKASVAYPKADWTWDDFLAAAQKLTVKGEGNNAQYGVVVQPDFTRLMPFIWQNGGEIVDNADAPTKLTLDSKEAEAAFEFFVELQTKQHVTPDEAQSRAMSITDRFLSGKAGMLIFSHRIVPSLRQAKFDWDVAPLPQSKKAATLLFSDGYCMAKAGQNKDAAWALIEFANSPEGQTILAKSGRSVPSLKAVAQSPAFLDPNARPKNNQIFLDMIATARTSPKLGNWADIEETVNRHLEESFYGVDPVDESIDMILKESQDMFKQ